MRKVSVIVFLWFMSLVPLLGQQFPSDLWHQGKVFLNNGEVVSGPVKYNLNLNSLNVDMKSTILTFSSKKVVRFQLMDKKSKRLRYFYSLPFALTGDYKVPIFFEVLHEGKLSLMCREKVAIETIYPYSNYRSRSLTRPVLSYDFYYLRSNVLKAYTDRNNQLLKVIMKDKADEIKKFMRKNRLKDDKRDDLALIFKYYNELVD